MPVLLLLAFCCSILAVHQQRGTAVGVPASLPPQQLCRHAFRRVCWMGPAWCGRRSGSTWCRHQARPV